MKFRVLITWGVAALLFGVLAASLAALTQVLGDAASTALSERLKDDNKVLMETWAYQQRVQHSEVRVAAAEPRLKAVVGSDEVGQTTIDGVADEMRDALGSDLFILIDSEGRVLVDANHEDAAGADMSENALVKETLQKGSGSAVWVEGDKAYQVQAEKLAFGGRGIGLLVTGRSINDEFADAVFRQTGAGVAVELNGKLIARSNSMDGQPLPTEEVAKAVSAAISGGDMHVQMAGDTYLMRTDMLPGYAGKHKVRYAIMRSLEKAMEPADRLTQILFYILSGALVVGIGFALWLSQLLSRPLENLAGFARTLGAGELQQRAKEEGPREVRSLASAMNGMAAELSTSRDQLADKERLEREMEIAENVQTSILPRVLNVEGFEIVADMLPAAEVGGDYYDVIPVSEGCWIGVGDVAGHGLPAGIIMLMIQSCVSSLVRAKPDASPSEHVEVLNRVIYENVRERLAATEHVTFTLLRFHRDGRVEYAGAHEEILILRAATGEVEQIRTTGTWLGGRPDIGKFTKDAGFALREGDRVCLYTDGIIEGRSASEEEFGVERLTAWLAASCKLSLAEAQKQLMTSVEEWTATQVDDVTAMLIEFKG